MLLGNCHLCSKTCQHIVAISSWKILRTGISFFLSFLLHRWPVGREKKNIKKKNIQLSAIVSLVIWIGRQTKMESNHFIMKMLWSELSGKQNQLEDTIIENKWKRYSDNWTQPLLWSSEMLVECSISLNNQILHWIKTLSCSHPIGAP